VEEFTNVKVTAQAVRKENKFASKALLSDDFFSRLGLGEGSKIFRKGGFDLNTISGISSVVKSRGFES
jgi:hypothetical protein